MRILDLKLLLAARWGIGREAASAKFLHSSVAFLKSELTLRVPELACCYDLNCFGESVVSCLCRALMCSRYSGESGSARAAALKPSVRGGISLGSSMSMMRMVVLPDGFDSPTCLIESIELYTFLVLEPIRLLKNNGYFSGLP